MTVDSKPQRVCVVEGWRPPNLKEANIRIEIATPADEQLTLDFLINETRLNEPLCASSSLSEEDAPALLEDLNRRSVTSNLSLLMFDGDELIGIRLTSLHETPADRKQKFELLPDYKEVIDAQQVATREQKRLHAIIESIYAVAANYLPDDCGPLYFDMEMVSIKRKYRGGNLSMRLYQELFKLAASKGIRYGKVLCTAQASKRVCTKLGMRAVLQVQYAKFLDDGEPCFQNTPDGSEFAQLFVADLQEMGYWERRRAFI